MTGYTRGGNLEIHRVCVLKGRNVMIHLSEGEKAARNKTVTVAHAHSDPPKGNRDDNLISHFGSNKPIVTGSFS